MSFSSVSIDEIRLPQVVNRDNKWLCFAITALGSCVLYLSSNYFPWRTPTVLPLTTFDRMIPVMPGTVWIYLSEYFLFVWAVLVCKNFGRLNRFFYAFITLQVSSVIFFCLFPTTFPREAFLLPEVNSFFAEKSMAMLLQLRTVDPPNNCLPSLHVASCIMFSMIFYGQSRRWFWFFSSWTFLISISTLTTKQHYFYDVVAGAVWTAAIYWLFFVKLDKKFDQV